MTFVNVPDLADVHTMLKLLEELGCKVTQEGHKVTLAYHFSRSSLRFS